MALRRLVYNGMLADGTDTLPHVLHLKIDCAGSEVGRFKLPEITGSHSDPLRTILSVLLDSEQKTPES